jgi:hypothetical protein
MSSSRGHVGGVATRASDVYMLGGAYLEIATACARTPFDWLSGFALTGYRWHESTRCIGPVQVQWHQDVAVWTTAFDIAIALIRRLCVACAHVCLCA